MRRWLRDLRFLLREWSLRTRHMLIESPRGVRNFFATAWWQVAENTHLLRRRLEGARNRGAGVRKFFATAWWQVAENTLFLRWGLGRAWGWGAGGRGRNIILGLPAVLAMGFALFVTLRVLAYPVTDLLKFYQAASEQALQDKNFQAARIAHERLCLLRGDLPEYRYGLAMAAIGLGELERARGLMSTIAPVRGPLGYGPAHLWMAQDLLTRQPATPQSLLTAEVQLHRAIKAQPDLVDARALLGMIYMNRQQYAEAESHLRSVAVTRPEYGLLLATIYSKKGDKQQTLIWADRTAKHAAERLRANPNDTASRVRLAETQILVGDFPVAMEVLRQGLQRPSGDAYRPALAKTCAGWVNSLPAETEEDRAKRRAILEQGLAYQPENSELLTLLVKAGEGTGAEATQAHALVETMLASGKASAALHFVLGNDANKREKIDLARLHFEQAHKLAPDHPLVSNNLAWLLATCDPLDLPRALELMDAAVKCIPQDMRLHQTRGRILAKMGRWKESLDELEACLEASPKDQELHRSLAEVYGKLNMTGLALRHSRLAESKQP